MSNISFQHLAIGVAFSPNLEANISEAARLACMFGADLLMIHVGAESSEKHDQIDACIQACEEKELRYQIIFKTGDPVQVILKTVQEHQVDLLLLGALKEENFVKFYLGSIARKLTRKVACSVLMLTNPSIKRKQAKHLVVNGIKDKHTRQTIATAFHVAHRLKSDLLTIVEEIDQQKVSIKIDDDDSLRRANLLKEQLKQEEEQRVQDLLASIPAEEKEGVRVETQPIFGKRGYSIGHYAQIVRADLLIMNAPRKPKLGDRIFPHDLEHILNELPTDVLVVR